MRRRVLTWHVHGTYLQMLGQVDHHFLVPVATGRPEGYIGLPPGRQWPVNLTEVDVEAIPEADIDCIMFQSDENWFDQHRVLTVEQRHLPRLYLEHDPPGHDGGSCFSSRHPVDDPEVTIVHVTHFNDLMWDTGRVPTTVIEHGVMDRGPMYEGDLDRGLVVVNNLALRGRRLGLDVYERVRDEIPLDLVGMGSAQVVGGRGEIPPDELAGYASRYRFFFHPIRYTSLGLALCEAMMAGLPIVALATTEAVTVVENGVNGFLSTNVEDLIEGMALLLSSPQAAKDMGQEARAVALRRFSLDRFVREWGQLISDVCDVPTRETVAP